MPVDRHGGFHFDMLFQCFSAFENTRYQVHGTNLWLLLIRKVPESPSSSQTSKYCPRGVPAHRGLVPATPKKIVSRPEDLKVLYLRDYSHAIQHSTTSSPGLPKRLRR